MLLTVLLAEVAGAAGLAKLGAGLGAGLAAIGIARQPEAGADIRMTMIIAAALVEGAALFAIVVCGFIL